MARDHDIKAEEARLTSRHPGSVSASLGLVINIGPRTPGRYTAHCTLHTVRWWGPQRMPFIAHPPALGPASLWFILYFWPNCSVMHPAPAAPVAEVPARFSPIPLLQLLHTHSLHPSFHLHNTLDTGFLLPVCTCWGDVTARPELWAEPHKNVRIWSKHPGPGRVNTHTRCCAAMLLQHSWSQWTVNCPRPKLTFSYKNDRNERTWEKMSSKVPIFNELRFKF